MLLKVVISFFPPLKPLEVSLAFVFIYTKHNSDNIHLKNVSNMSIMYPFIHLFKTFLLCSYYVRGMENKAVVQVMIVLELMEFRAS